METKHKTTFASIPGSVRVVEPTEETRKEIKASLGQLRALLPAHIDPQDEPALLFVAANLAVAGVINLNDDGLSRDDGLATYKKFEKQQINLEHDRKNVRGYIIHAGLSEFGTDRIITEEEARESGQPFNIAVVIALWKTVDKELCNYILEASSPTNPDFKALSLSFEVGFEDYHIIGLPTAPSYDNIEISRASIVVKPGDSGFIDFDAKLRANGGDGFAPHDGNVRLYRIIDSGIVPLGGGIVTMPAAFVKGITAITESPHTAQSSEVAMLAAEEDRLAQLAQEQADQDLAAARVLVASLASNLTDKVNSFLNPSKTGVSLNTPNTITQSTMKHDIQSLKDAASKATKLEDLQSVVANAIDLTTIITQESERREQARKDAAESASKIEAAKLAAEESAAKLQKDLDEVRAQLEQIRAEQVAVAAEQQFQERMTALNEVFDVDADSAQFFAEEVKSCDSDESFAKKLEKLKKLMPEKTKDFKKKKAEDAKAAKAKMEEMLSKANVTAKFNEVSLELEEAIASAVANPISAPIPNVVTPETGDIKDLAKRAFGNMTIGGKTAEQLTKKD